MRRRRQSIPRLRRQRTRRGRGRRGDREHSTEDTVTDHASGTEEEEIHVTGIVL